MNFKRHLAAKKDQMRMLHTNNNITEMMSNALISWLPETPREYVIVCIGTDRSTGDAFGPLTGYFLSELKPKHIHVHGTLQEPVHATNMEDHIHYIKHTYRQPYIIAVDACLGKSSSVGHIIAGMGSIKPGAALNKSLPEIGDIHMTGVVNVSGFMEHSVLQNTRLSVVVDMAKRAADILNKIDQTLTYHITTPAIVVQDQNKSSI
ncbi:spore protease YyaC [Virgibacillus kimchii]